MAPKASARATGAKARAQRALRLRRDPDSNGDEYAAPAYTAENAADGIAAAAGVPTVHGPLLVFRERVRCRHDPDTIGMQAASRERWALLAGALRQCPTWVPDTISDLNLQLWCEYRRSNMAEADRIAGDMYYIQHKPYESQGYDVTGLPRRLCVDSACARCQHQEGGYRFWWVSSKWTPVLALAEAWPNGFAPGQRRQIAWHNPFPIGIGIGASDPFRLEAPGPLR